MHPADSYMRIVSHSRGQSLEMWIVPAAEWLRMRTSMRTSWVPHQNDRVSIIDTSDAIWQKSWINSSTSAATCRIWRVVFVLQRHALCMLFPTCVRGNHLHCLHVDSFVVLQIVAIRPISICYCNFCSACLSFPQFFPITCFCCVLSIISPTLISCTSMSEIEAAFFIRQLRARPV